MASQCWQLVGSAVVVLAVAPSFGQCAQDGREAGSDSPIPKKLLADLVRDLDAKDASASFKAYEKLVDLGPEAAGAVPYLIDRFKKQKDHTSVIVLGKIGSASKDAVPLLVDLLKARVQGGPEKHELAYGNSKYGPWTDAVRSLGEIGPGAKAAVPDLIALMKDPDSEVRGDVCEALGLIGPAASKAVPSLIEAMSDKNPATGSSLRFPFEVRRCAVIALGRVGPEAKSAVPKLIGNLTDADDGVRYDSLRSLGQIGPEADSAVPHLIKALESDPPAKLRAIVSLGQIGPKAKQALVPLRALMNAEDELFRQQIVEAISQIEKSQAK